MLTSLRLRVPSGLFTKRNLLPLALLVVLFAQCLFFAVNTGQTVDETYYNGSGYPIVRYNNYEFLGEHPPLIIQISSLPLLLLQPRFPILDPIRLPGSNAVDISKTGAKFLYKMGNDPEVILFLERLPLVVLTTLLGLGIFLLGREFYGPEGALLALSLFVFSPDVIGNGSLFMTDMGVTAFYFFAIYALKKFCDSPSASRIVALGLLCGLAFMSKISGLILLPVITCLGAIFYLTQGRSCSIQPTSTVFEKWMAGISFFLVANALGDKLAMVVFGPFCLFSVYFFARDFAWVQRSRATRIVLRGLVLAGAALCVIYSIKLKKKYGISLAMVSAVGSLIFLAVAVMFSRLPPADNRIRFLKYYLSIWVIAALVIVLGYTDFIYKTHRFIGFGNFNRPLSIVLSHSAGGHGACIEGSFITCDWKYFPIMMAVKMPVLTLLLAGTGVLFLVRSKWPIFKKAFLLVPLIFFLGAAMLNKINIGIRHILPILPFIFLLGGIPGAALASMKSSNVKKILAGALIVFLVFSAGRTLCTAPHYLSFFNEMIGSSEQGAHIASMNWGQDNKSLAKFVRDKKIPLIKIATESSNSDIYDYYKIPWKWMEDKDFLNPTAGFYALGLGVYLDHQKNSYSWFQGRKPIVKIGKTIYVFEVKSTD